MAQVAFFFHWSLAEMDAMPPQELMDWCQRAVGIHNQLQNPEK